MKQNIKIIQAIAKKIKEKFPAIKPVSIRVCITPYNRDMYGILTKPKTRVMGCAEDKKGYFLIRINKNEDFNTQLDTLIHEYAHVLANWHALEDPHSKAWGIQYAKIYREVMSW